MKTAAIGIENLCVQCHSFCRYCLLSSNGNICGTTYERGKYFTEKFAGELGVTHPELRVFHYIGCSMDTPDLADYIRFSRATGGPSANFLQFNGLKLRDEKETSALIKMVKDEGIENIDLTFYGTREYHDRFAGRAGDFDFLLRILSAAETEQLNVRCSVPVTQENMGQTEELRRSLAKRCTGKISFFLPHCKGRGAALESVRLTARDLEGLSSEVRSSFYDVQYKTEAQWLAERSWPAVSKRTLTLCITRENIDALERMSAGEIVACLEKLDDDYWNAMPSLDRLADLYGDTGSDRLFRVRALHLLWQQYYLKEHPDIFDMNDESHHFSVRY